MISVHSYHVTVGLLYLTVAGIAKTRMRNKMCNCASRLIEHSSEQTIVCIRASVSFIVKFIPFLAVFNQLTLGEDIEKIPGPSYAIEMFKLGTFHHGDKGFGKTAGVQRAYNSLFALCCQKVEKFQSGSR